MSRISWSFSEAGSEFEVGASKLPELELGVSILPAARKQKKHRDTTDKMFFLITGDIIPSAEPLI
jgi:hypothetical protein